jgi:nucleotide-binding universal stress UspA family protein
MRDDREYIERLAARLSTEGLRAEALLASGDPSAEIAAAADREHCDLIAMSTHGHRFIGDLIYGSVANAVRHMTSVPVLLLRAPGNAKQKVAAT